MSPKTCKVCEDSIEKEDNYYVCRVSGAIVCNACQNDISYAKESMDKGIFKKWFR